MASIKFGKAMVSVKCWQEHGKADLSSMQLVNDLLPPRALFGQVQLATNGQL